MFAFKRIATFLSFSTVILSAAAGVIQSRGLTTLPNGTKLNIVTSGSGDKVIFLHGLGGSHEVFEPAIALGNLKVTSIRVDIAGHASSPPNSNPTVIESYLADLESLVASLNVKKITIVGHSWGSILGALYASKHPTMISKLALFAPPYTPIDPAITAIQEGMLAVVRANGTAAIADAFVASLFNPTGDTTRDTALAASLKHLLFETTSPHFADSFQGITAWEARANSGINWATFNSFPFLLVGGSLDQLHPPAWLQTIKSIATNAQYINLPNLGHYVPLEDIPKTASLLKTFLG